jgi:hypothetical protein
VGGEGEGDPTPPRWFLASACALAFTAAMTIITFLNWRNGPVGTVLVVVSALVVLAVTVLTTLLPGATRKQVAVAGALVVVVLGGVLGASWKWGQADPVPVAELAPPKQRDLGELHSACGVPGAELLTGAGSSRIRAARVATGSKEIGDFVVALVSEVRPPAGSFLTPVRLVVLDCDGTAWRRTATDLTTTDCASELEVTQLRRADREDVLATAICGSGAFLDYSLLGIPEGETVARTLHEEQGLGGGSATQLRDRLVVQARGGRRREELVWTGDRFVADAAVSSAPGGEGLIVKFWWDGQGGDIDLSDVPVTPGERVYFRWDRDRSTDPSVTSYRMMTSGTDPLEQETDGRGESYVVLTEPGASAKVTLVPNYGDWDRAVVATLRS